MHWIPGWYTFLTEEEAQLVQETVDGHPHATR